MRLSDCQLYVTVRRSADIRGGDHHGNSGDSAQRTDLRSVTAEKHRRLFND